MAGKWRLYIDDTGAVDAGAYVEVEAAINAPQNQSWKTITSPVCIGDEFETEEPEVKQLAVPAQIKVKKGSTIDTRLHAAFNAGTQQGVLIASGDVNAAGAAGGGHKQLEFNALVKTYNITQQAGSTIVYDVLFVPHSDNTDVDVPSSSISTDNP